jgi:hypothetical protein
MLFFSFFADGSCRWLPMLNKFTVVLMLLLNADDMLVCFWVPRETALWQSYRTISPSRQASCMNTSSSLMSLGEWTIAYHTRVLAMPCCTPSFSFKTLSREGISPVNALHGCSASILICMLDIKSCRASSESYVRINGCVPNCSTCSFPIRLLKLRIKKHQLLVYNAKRTC